MKNISIKLNKYSLIVPFSIKSFLSHLGLCFFGTFSSSRNSSFIPRITYSHTFLRTIDCISTWKNILFFTTNFTRNIFTFSYIKNYLSRFLKPSKLVFTGMFISNVNSRRPIDCKIIYSIIIFYVVNMMNNLFFFKKSTKFFLNNKSVFKIISFYSTIWMFWNKSINVAFLADLRSAWIVREVGDVQCLLN